MSCLIMNNIHKLIFIEIFYHYFCEANINFRSCSDALISKKSGEYSIQPLPNGNVSSVTCKVLNETHGMLILGNSREKLIHLHNRSDCETVLCPETIKYGNFDEADMNELLKHAGECSQTMVSQNRAVLIGFQQYLFWDGTLLTSFNASGFSDICQCFIRQVCDDKNDPTASCYITGRNKDPLLTDSGEFSVNSSLLPIKEIRTGDIGNFGEEVKYSVGKLKCIFKMPKRVSVKKISCSKNLSNLVDKNPLTCLHFNHSFNFELESPFISNSTRIETNLINNNCESKIFVFIGEENAKKQCNFIEKCTFECFPSKLFYVHVIIQANENISICEINLNL